MKNKIENVKDFCKEHKWEIIGGVATVIGGTVLFKTIKGKSNGKVGRTEINIPVSNLGHQDFEKPEVSIGEIIEFWVDGRGDCPKMIVDNLTVGNIGDFMNEICEKVPEINPETPIDILVGFGIDEC